MKRCPYCGTEYPDDASVCAIDRQPLPENISHPPPASGQIIDPTQGAADDGAVPPQGQMETTDKNIPYLTFPDYRWTARDAWKCLGMFLALELITGMFLSVLDWKLHGFYRWRGGGFGHFVVRVSLYSLQLLVAAYFARTEKLAAFWKGFGLDRKPSDYAWFGVTTAVIIRLLGHVIIVQGWGKGVSNHDISAFRYTPGFEKYFFLAPLLLLAPVFEESINRGFLYKAFRGSYPIGFSVALIVAWTAWTHSEQYFHTWVAVVDLSLLTLVQCYLREKSDSLWDCILCHLAYNGSGLFIDGVFR
jgi:membrane protease YdiL (CAAX protease family)